MTFRTLSRQSCATYLRSLGVTHDALITIVWASEAYGVVLRFRDFVAFYDDWWYPSSDDVWVSAHNASWLLELDHDEMLRFRRNATSP